MGGGGRRQASERGIDGGLFRQHPLPSEPPGNTLLFGTQTPLLTHMRVSQTTGNPGGDEKHVPSLWKLCLLYGPCSCPARSPELHSPQRTQIPNSPTTSLFSILVASGSCDLMPCWALIPSPSPSSWTIFFFVFVTLTEWLQLDALSRKEVLFGSQWRSGPVHPGQKNGRGQLYAKVAEHVSQQPFLPP